MSFINRARVILVGSGRMGQIRASLLYANPRFEITGIVDSDMSAASNLAEVYSTKPFNSLSEAMLYNNQKSYEEGLAPVNAAVISSPTFTHKDLIVEAADHGLSVFTEKPVDETAEKIKYLFHYCDAKGTKLCCSFQRRFDESYLATQEALNKGVIGKALTARIFFGDHPCPPPEFLLAGGEIFMDLSAHDVDYIRWCLDDEVESVYATGTSSNKMLQEAGVHDNATLLLNFRKGAVVTIFMSRSASYGYDQRCEIFGEGGLLKIENEHNHCSTLSNNRGIHLANLKHSFPQRFHQAYKAELDAFADTILNGESWPITSKDCIAVQKIAEAALLSSKTKNVVNIDFQDDYNESEQAISFAQ